MKQYYTKKEVLEIYPISQSTLQRYMRAGLKSIMYKGKMRFDIADLHKWLAEFEVDAEVARKIEEDESK